MARQEEAKFLARGTSTSPRRFHDKKHDIIEIYDIIGLCYTKYLISEAEKGNALM
jgi:hypothetical protein